MPARRVATTPNGPAALVTPGARTTEEYSMATTKPTGHVEVRKRGGGPTFYAKLKLPDGSQPRRKLGRVWTKRSQPPDGYLTRGQAEARLEAILVGDDPLVNVAPSHVTFKQACDERLRHLEYDKQRKPSTLADYRNVINRDLLSWFGEDTPVEDITTGDVEALRDALIARVSHRTAQKVLVILHGIMARAKRKGWIKTNPCEDAEKVTLTASDEFNILEPEQVFALARETTDPTTAALFTFAAFTGLRCPGELLALRWQHVDFANRIVHVLRNFTRGA